MFPKSCEKHAKPIQLNISGLTDCHLETELKDLHCSVNFRLCILITKMMGMTEACHS